MPRRIELYIAAVWFLLPKKENHSAWTVTECWECTWRQGNFNFVAEDFKNERGRTSWKRVSYVEACPWICRMQCGMACFWMPGKKNGELTCKFEGIFSVAEEKALERKGYMPLHILPKWMSKGLVSLGRFHVKWREANGCFWFGYSCWKSRQMWLKSRVRNLG